jgi:hypothetical protein
MTYVYRWRNALCTTEHSTHVLIQYRDALDMQSQTAVVWQPYIDYIPSLPEYCTRNGSNWRAICPLICFCIVEWHRPDRVLRQFGLIQGIPVMCENEARLHRIDLRGNPDTDWRIKHAAYIELWAHRAENIANGAREVPGYDYGPYMTWYRRITRWSIGRTGARHDYTVSKIYFHFRYCP